MRKNIAKRHSTPIKLLSMM